MICSIHGTSTQLTIQCDKWLKHGMLSSFDRFMIEFDDDNDYDELSELHLCLAISRAALGGSWFFH